MAGSYNHVVADDGQLLVPEYFAGMIDHLPDAYQAIEEMYGMIWWLAEKAAAGQDATAASLVEAARQAYRDGLQLSPGTGGTLPPES
ncbi:hypothetical protein ABJI51_16895 [Amycolatopsis sp. NEAU-NG30]|uniref:Uncharacterized protein n=1 Tax=Amycolatopsis melonis TaxID=3156488 RepID=A0ABV0LF20_9PSEU